MLDTNKALYWYKARVGRVIDGDTLCLDVDVGYKCWIKDTVVRLYGINTPEVRGEERPLGLRVKAIVTEELLDKEIVIRSFKGDDQDKYGRWLVYVYLDGENYNQSLVDRGLAIPYMD